MKTIRDLVVELGATDQQVDSKIFHMVEQAIADNAVDGLADARKSVVDLQSKLDNASSGLDSSISRAMGLYSQLNHTIAEAKEARGELSASVDDVRINDEALRDAINAYTMILSRTKDVLGDDAMTEPVIIQLLETASYGLWRSIMGPKEQPKQRTR